jgi:UDP-glucuronate 4-epimerase
MAILITGAAGFIGFHVAQHLLKHNHQIFGIDNINEYYDPILKQERLKILKSYDNFSFKKIDIAHNEELATIFSANKFDAVIHLAAQAGVRYSLENPQVYIDSNLVGFFNLLENCKQATTIKHFVFASSSSVYGANTDYPYSERQNTDHPISLYAATKKSNEIMAHSYASLYNLPCTGLRLFTVYGPWGRPDMALFKFTKNILSNKPIDIYNNGDMKRDFTYVDDVADCITCCLKKPPTPNPSWNSNKPNPATSFAPYRIYNIGNSSPAQLMNVIELLEQTLGKTAIKNFLPMQPGDAKETYADTTFLQNNFHHKPQTNLEIGIKKFTDWYLEYYLQNHAH